MNNSDSDCGILRLRLLTERGENMPEAVLKEDFSWENEVDPELTLEELLEEFNDDGFDDTDRDGEVWGPLDPDAVFQRRPKKKKK